MADNIRPDTYPRAHFMESWWAQAVVVVAIVAAFAVAFVWAAKRDVVANWKVLATCSAPKEATFERSTPVVDTSPCSIDQVTVNRARGWPVLAFRPARDGRHRSEGDRTHSE